MPATCEQGGCPILSVSVRRHSLLHPLEICCAWRRGDYVDMAPQGQYRNQTYVLDAPCRQLAMLGIHGQFSLIDLDQELLVVGYGSHPAQADEVLISALLSFWDRIREHLQ